jgi:sugar/nucleoside kinase (ribokinase family)
MLGSRKMDLDVMVIGDAIIDIVIRYDRNFLRNGAAFYDGALSYGGAGNVAVDASILGLKASMVGKVGEDALGHLYIDDLVKHNVLSQLVMEDSSYTGFLVSLVHQEGERSFLVCRGANDRFSEKDVRKAFDQARPRFVFIQGYGIATAQRKALLYAAKEARNSGATVIYDPAAYNIVQDHKEFIMGSLIKCVDVCLPNFEEAKALTGCADLGRIGKVLNKLVPRSIVKLGAEGAAVFSRGEKTAHHRTQRVKPTNTTGAGDAFASAVVYGLSRNLPLELIIEFANRIAAKKIQSLNSRLSLKKMELKALLSELKRYE